ncbi:MAG: hypothetical protein MZU97_12385 [Bacillus subtilis]|nr:hypothetical protein [Bacillus subtilis]
MAEQALRRNRGGCREGEVGKGEGVALTDSFRRQRFPAVQPYGTGPEGFEDGGKRYVAQQSPDDAIHALAVVVSSGDEAIAKGHAPSYALYQNESRKSRRSQLPP